MSDRTPRNYREESELREVVAETIDWSCVTPETRRVFLATYFPGHPRLHVALDTFQDYRVAFFRQPHRVDHHCHLQTLQVLGGHIRQILGFLTGQAKYLRLQNTTAWERLQRVPAHVRDMQRCGASANDIYSEVLERYVRPFLRDTGTYPNLFRLVMQTFYSDHNRLTPRGEIEEAQAALEGLVDYCHIPQAVELDVWSEDLLAATRKNGASASALALVRPKRQLIVSPVDGVASEDTIRTLAETAAYTERLRTGQLLELTRRMLDERFFSEVLRRNGMRLTTEAEDFVRRWTRVFLEYYDDQETRASLNPVTISNKALELFLLGQAEREARREGWDDERLFGLKREIESFLPKAKSLMKDQFAVARRYPPYLDVLRRFGEECLIFEAHPAAQHFKTGALTNRELLDLMTPVYQAAREAGLTGLELNRGEAFNEVVLEVAERLQLYLSVASDFHSLSLSRAKGLKGDREYGCARNIPAVLFQFPNIEGPVTLTPLEVARSLGRLVGRPVPDEFFPSRVAAQPITFLEGAGAEEPHVKRRGRVPPALLEARTRRPRFAMPEGGLRDVWTLTERLEERFVDDGALRMGELSWLVEFALLCQAPQISDGDTAEETAVANSLYHGFRALELLQAETGVEPPLPLAVATALHDVGRAFGHRDEAWYDDDYRRYKAAEQQHAQRLARRLLHEVRFPPEHHAPILFLIAHHEDGAQVREKAILRANVGVPVHQMKEMCRLIDLADAFVFFEPLSVERYLRRRGSDRLRRKVRFTLDLDPAGRALAEGRVQSLMEAGRYGTALSEILTEELSGETRDA